jgi:hypothetical protein
MSFFDNGGFPTPVVDPKRIKGLLVNRALSVLSAYRTTLNVNEYRVPMFRVVYSAACKCTVYSGEEPAFIIDLTFQMYPSNPRKTVESRSPEALTPAYHPAPCAFESCR